MKKRRQRGNLRKLTHGERERRLARNIKRGRVAAPPTPATVQANKIREQLALAEELQKRSGWGRWNAIYAVRIRKLKRALAKFE